MKRLSFCFSVLIVVVALIALSPSTHAANLITNGSFEADSCNAGGSGYRLGLSGGDMSGWFIPSGDGVYPWCLTNTNPFTAGPAAEGDQWLVLGRWDTGVEYTIQQTLTGLTVGQSYNLSFAIASERGCCSNAEVSFLAGSSTGSATFDAPLSGSHWTAWGYHSMLFLADASSVTIQFKNLKPLFDDGIDLGLDDVSVEVAGVPEPASLTLLGLGSLLLGAAYRRRKA